jgi:hypothetical protein
MGGWFPCPMYRPFSPPVALSLRYVLIRRRQRVKRCRWGRRNRVVRGSKGLFVLSLAHPDEHLGVQEPITLGGRSRQCPVDKVLCFVLLRCIAP